MKVLRADRECRRCSRPLRRLWARAWKDVALITDGRFSGGSHGFLVGHITPEAQEGGPIGLLESGDQITIDAEKRTLDVQLTEGEFAARREMGDAAVQSRAGHALQVHQERQIGVGGLRDG